MAWVRPPRLQSEYALRFLRQVVGSSKPFVVVLGLLFTIAAGVSGNAAWGILQHVLASTAPADFSWLAHLAGLVVFPAFFTLLWIFLSIRASQTVRVSVIQDKEPPQVRGLILFLSPPGLKDKQLIDEIREGKISCQLADPAGRAKFNGPWRMPLEAIAYHLARLKRVVLIPSQDSEKSIGTWHDVEAFRALTKQLLGPDHASALQILDLSSLLQEATKLHAQEQSRRRNEGMRWASLIQQLVDPDRRWSLWERIAKTLAQEPVDPGNQDAHGGNFEDASQIADAVELAHELLRICDVPVCDILIDVTGGQKPSTVAGAPYLWPRVGDSNM